MRILMTADAAGGVGVFADELATALVARGHQVLVVVFSLTRPAFTPGLHRLWAPFRLEWMDTGGEAGALAADALAGRAFLLDLAQHWRPQILHSNQFAFAGALPRIPTVLSVHSDVVSWWRIVHATPPPANAYQRWYAATARQALASAALVVTPSQAARADLLASFGAPRPVRVIVNGRSPHQFTCGQKQPFALAAGRLWDAGKQMHLLAALRPIANLELTLAGERLHPAGGTPAAMPANLRCLGHLPPPALHDWMARAPTFIGTSLYEPFGLAVLEAAFSGCALLLNDIPSWRELWGPAALFYSNLEQLQHLLERVASHPDWAQAHGQTARRHACRRYTAVRMAQAYEAVYRQAMTAAV
ncbi:MAG: glycosyltransferase family 4 protein [Terriglobales bacterium]